MIPLLPTMFLTFGRAVIWFIWSPGETDLERDGYPRILLSVLDPNDLIHSIVVAVVLVKKVLTKLQIFKLEPYPNI